MQALDDGFLKSGGYLSGFGKPPSRMFGVDEGVVAFDVEDAFISGDEGHYGHVVLVLDHDFLGDAHGVA